MSYRSETSKCSIKIEDKQLNPNYRVEKVIINYLDRWINKFLEENVNIHKVWETTDIINLWYYHNFTIFKE
jgi:hypothetical protein